MSTSNPSPSKSFKLEVLRPNEDVAIEIYDAFDRLIAAPRDLQRATVSSIQDTTAGERLSILVPRGLYLVRRSLGNDFEENVVRVDSDTTIDAPMPARVTSIPYEGATSSHEYYSEPAEGYSQQATTSALNLAGPGNSWLFIFVRALDQESYHKSSVKLEDAVRRLYLETPQGEVIPLAEQSKFHPDGWMAFSTPASPGDYLLHNLSDERRTMPVLVEQDWRTQLFLMFNDRILFRSCKVSYSRPNKSFNPQASSDRAVDLALSVLSAGEGALPAKGQQILSGDKIENPILGLAVAWIALRDSSLPIKLAETILENLSRLLPGWSDVAVLRAVLARRQKQQTPSQPIRRIPILQTSVSELIRASADHPEILSDDSVLNKVSPRLYGDSVFTSWQPLESELPEFLKPKRGSHRGFSFLPAMLGMRIAESVRAGSLSDSLSRDEKRDSLAASAEDQGTWLTDVVSDMIEQQARGEIRGSEISSLNAAQLDLAGLARRTGVTAVALRNALKAVPLDGKQIAVSLSNTSIISRHADTAVDPLDEATEFLTRSLVAAGASIAYGGDFRKGGYTELLAEVIASYNKTGTRPAQALHCYLGAPIKIGDALRDHRLTVHHMVESPDVAVDAIIPKSTLIEERAWGLYYSDMRQVMAKHTFARVILGGQTEPRLKDNGPGYGGRYPGVVEEAWRTLQAGKPLYVIGGFGGASALVADLLERQPIPKQFMDETYLTSDYFRTTAEAIDSAKAADGRLLREMLGLPRTMDDLAKVVCELGIPHLANDDESTRWNGLTVAENRTLFRNQDPLVLTSLVLKGLLAAIQR